MTTTATRPRFRPTGGQPAPGRARRHDRGTLARFLVLAPLGGLFLMPLLLVAIGAGKRSDEVFSPGWTVFDPAGFHALGRNVRAAWTGTGEAGFAVSLRTSLIVTVSTVVLGLAVNSLAGYALARLPFRGRRFVLGLVVAFIIVPFETIAVPLFLLSVQPVFGMRLANSLLAQILPFIAQPLHIFLFYSFFKGIPAELEEAAQLDGAGVWRTFRSVIMPLAAPAYASSAILMFLYSWGQFLWPLMVAGDRRDLQPLPLGLWNFNGTTPDWGGFYAYTLFMVLPVILVFLVLQRWFVQGIATSGLKG